MRNILILSCFTLMLTCAESLWGSMQRVRTGPESEINLFLTRNKIYRLTSTEGVVIEARITRFDDRSGLVTAVLAADGQEVRFPISLLESASAQTVMDWHIKDSLNRGAVIDVQVKRTSRHENVSVGYSDYYYTLPRAPGETGRPQYGRMDSERHQMYLSFRNNVTVEIPELRVFYGIEIMRRASNPGRTEGTPRLPIDGSHSESSFHNFRKGLAAGAAVELEGPSIILQSYIRRYQRSSGRMSSEAVIRVDDRIVNYYVVLIYKSDPVVAWVWDPRRSHLFDARLIKWGNSSGQNSMQNMIEEEKLYRR